MCGIYGYIGKNSIKQVMEGIAKLEYRGYDSAGIAFLQEGDEIACNDFVQKYDNLTVVRQKGQLKELKKIIDKLPLKSQLCIGHTRWATHGKPSISNSHPHVSDDGKWALVHNGIIENCKEIKSRLRNVNLKSETDSEIVVQYFAQIYNGSPLETLKKLCSSLQGSYAFAFISPMFPDKIFVAKNSSPVVVGADDESGVVCSDLNSMVGADEVYLLENGEFAVVEKGKATVYDNNLKEKACKNLADVIKEKQAGLGRYKHYMLKEIDEIPQAIVKTVKNYDQFDKIRKALPLTVARKIKRILIVACGTAYHAGLIGKYLFEEEGLPVRCEIASEFRYNTFIQEKNMLAIFVSQSGETADTITALKLCKERGIPTLAITNVKNSSITFEADRVIYTNAGAEIGVASTKAYNSQLAIFYLLSAYFKAIKINDKNLVAKETDSLIFTAQKIAGNKIKPLCRKIAQEIKNSLSIYMIGRGFDFNIAQEASLKLKEISYIHCEAYPSGELKHGTISLIDKDKFVFAFACNSKTYSKTISGVSEVASRDGKVILFSPFPTSKKHLFRFVKLPQLEPRYYPIFVIVYMQLIAYYTSTVLGFDPDKPRSLAKSVTVE